MLDYLKKYLKSIDMTAIDGVLRWLVRLPELPAGVVDTAGAAANVQQPA
jgi:hypothetical protein